MVRPKIDLLECSKKVPADLKAQLELISKNFPRGMVAVIAFRGYYLDTMGKPGENDRNIYDDCMCVVSPDKYVTFNANTDPTRYKQGVATLVPGLHLYKQGKHGITTHADGGYNAFRPATPDESLPVWRDGQEWGVKVFKGIAINIHRGGYTVTSSEGCQTVYPDQWNEFQTTVYDLMKKYGQKTLPYVLVNWTN